MTAHELRMRLCILTGENILPNVKYQLNSVPWGFLTTPLNMTYVCSSGLTRLKKNSIGIIARVCLHSNSPEQIAPTKHAFVKELLTQRMHMLWFTLEMYALNRLVGSYNLQGLYWCMLLICLK